MIAFEQALGDHLMPVNTNGATACALRRRSLPDASM
jgi:hypothetical protein